VVDDDIQSADQQDGACRTEEGANAGREAVGILGGVVIVGGDALVEAGALWHTQLFAVLLTAGFLGIRLLGDSHDDEHSDQEVGGNHDRLPVFLFHLHERILQPHFHKEGT